MRRLFCMLLVFSITLTLLPPAMADHSRIPGDGIMDETAAVDAAVAYLCQSLGFCEEKVRGKFYYRTLCYESGWKFKGPVWSMTVIDPTVNEDGRTLVSYNYEINALTGEVLDEGTSDSGWFVGELRSIPVIPRKDWVQPAEAIDRAREMIRKVLGLGDEAMKDHWRDYWLDGWNENGEYRYWVTVGDPDLWEKAWQAVLDVETGSVVWHTDPLRFAARHSIEENGGYENWYRGQRETYAAKWGDPDTWDYRKWAEFEEHCFGSPLYPDAHCGLPGEGDCSLEEAMDAVGRYLGFYAGPGMDTDAWTVRGSVFLLDHTDETDPYQLPGYLSGTHVWELLVYFEVTGELALITVDAANAEVIGDEPVNENGEWSFLSPVESVYETGDEQMNADMKQASQVLAEKVSEACGENDGIVSLQVRLGLFYDHEVMGIDQHGGSVTLYRSLDDDQSVMLFDHAWSAHCGERTYYDEFETLAAQALRDKGCPPAEFIHPEGQAGKLLQKRNELWDAIGDRREIGGILEAILPVWPFPDAGSGMVLLEAGSYDSFNAGEFTVSWTWQEEDENSDEYYQLRIELCYAADETNRDISECDWLDDPCVDLRNAVRSTAAYQWALGRKADRISVMVEGT